MTPLVIFSRHVGGVAEMIFFILASFSIRILVLYLNKVVTLYYFIVILA
jgi:hypothetical protein